MNRLLKKEIIADLHGAGKGVVENVLALLDLEIASAREEMECAGETVEIWRNQGKVQALKQLGDAIRSRRNYERN